MKQVFATLEHGLEVALVGRLNREDRALVSRLGLDEIVRTSGQLPHAEAVEYFNWADLLYLPFWWSEKVGRVIRAPSKLYEYIGTRKPILAVVGDGDVRDVLRKAGTGVFCTEPSEEKLAERLVSVYENRAGLSKQCRANDDYIDRFQWKNLTEELASVIDAAIEQKSHAEVR